jgi:hypothetical protein
MPSLDITTNPDGTRTLQLPNGMVRQLPPVSPQAPTFFQSPPGSGGNDGAMPLAYEPLWQYFTNLTPAQIAAFQAMPEWTAFVAKVQADPSGTSIPVPAPT